MTTNHPSDAERIGRAFTSALHEHWVLFLVEGIILVILGVGAILLPPLATLAVEIIIGWVFLISGIVGLVTTFWMRHAPGFWWSLISGLVGIAAGIVLLLWPLSGALSLTLILIAFFIIEGVASIMYAIEHRSQLPDAGVGCSSAASSTCCLPRSFSPGCPERLPGHSVSWSESTWYSAGRRSSPSPWPRGIRQALRA